MCLVSFIPQTDGYVLSSNRDELPSRAAMSIVKDQRSSNEITFPADIKGGSWIIMSSNHRVVCLLNGAFENHQHCPTYRLSRGVMMKEFFEINSAVDFFEHYNFDLIEPFTMIIPEGSNLFEFRWDGALKHIKVLDTNVIHIWSSCTLYDSETQHQRAKILLNRIDDTKNLDNYHLKEIHTSPSSAHTELFIKRADGIQTISHTQIVKADKSLQMNHYDLLQNTVLSAQY